MNLNKLLNGLEKVKPTGNNRWTACCPAHDDKSPSLHVKLDDSGKILINCKAGCGVEDIIGAIGIEWSDLMPDEPTHHRKKPQKRIIYSSEGLQLLRREAQIILACGYAIRRGDITQSDIERTEKAMKIINKVYEACQ